MYYQHLSSLAAVNITLLPDNCTSFNSNVDYRFLMSNAPTSIMSSLLGLAGEFNLLYEHDVFVVTVFVCLFLIFTFVELGMLLLFFLWVCC